MYFLMYNILLLINPCVYNYFKLYFKNFNIKLMITRIK